MKLTYFFDDSLDGITDITTEGTPPAVGEIVTFRNYDRMDGSSGRFFQVRQLNRTVGRRSLHIPSLLLKLQPPGVHWDNEQCFEALLNYAKSEGGSGMRFSVDDRKHLWYYIDEYEVMLSEVTVHGTPVEK